MAGAGSQVKAVWAADGADSTGIFHGARGQGYDTAYPAKNTAAPQGTLTLARRRRQAAVDVVFDGAEL